MKKKLFILDVSGYIFRAYYAIPHMSSPKGEATNALFGFIRSVIKLFKDFSPTHLVAVFDGPDNKKQRVEIYEKYKSNRIRLHEDLPEQMERSKQLCDLLGIQHIEVPGVEADDTIGTIALRAKSQGFEVWICTGDKDLAQLVQEDIYLLNTWKDNLLIDSSKVKEIYGVSPERIVDLLALMGDSSDNIPGVSGIGPKTGVQLLEEFGSLENLLERVDDVKGKKKETLKAEADMAKLSKRLATIHVDIPLPERVDYSIQETDLFGLKEFYLELGFHSLVQEMDEELKKQSPIEKTDYILVKDEKTFITALRILSQSEEIALDVVASNLSPLQAYPVGIGFSTKEKEAYYFPLNGDLEKEWILDKLRTLFEDPRIRFFGHNIKYDLHILANVGIQIASVQFDTMLASYLLHSGSKRHSLDDLALHYFGKLKTPIKALIGAGKKEIPMTDVLIPVLKDYCCEEADFTFRLKGLLEKNIEKRNLKSLLHDMELPLTSVLFKMERAGVYIDTLHLKRFSKEVGVEIKRLEEEIYSMAGETFNLSSPKQLSSILFDKLQIKPLKKTATGLSTRADVLEILADEYPIAEKILQFRGFEKLRSTYLDALPESVNPKTGRVHPNFNQFVTATGRLACQDPNLQNIPIKTELGRKIREAFRPSKPNWSYISADYSQIELRLLAHLSEDPELIQAFMRGEDIHAYTAALVFSTPLAEVTSKQRSLAKGINFGIIYGQQAYGLSQVLGIDVKKSAEFIEAYFERYPKVGAFFQASIEQARKDGKVRTMIGREREIVEIFSSNSQVRAAGERLAMNTPLQGSAADLIKLAMLEIDRVFSEKNLESFMVLQVHDELIFEVPDEEIELVSPLIKKAMEGVFSLQVPLVVDVKVGKNWAEC